jgi:hypothetical protein
MEEGRRIESLPLLVLTLSLSLCYSDIKKKKREIKMKEA